MGELFRVKQNKDLVINGENFLYFTEDDREFLSTVIDNGGYNDWNLNCDNILAHNYEEYMHIVYQRIENALCMYAYYPTVRKRFMEMAFVPMSVDGRKVNYNSVLSKMEKVLAKVNTACDFQTGFFVPQEAVPTMRQFMKSVSKATGFVEFVYNIEYLAALEGSKLKNVRRDYNRFERDYPDVKLVPYAPEHERACVQLKYKWEEEYEARTTQNAKWKESFKYHLKHLFNSDDTFAFVLVDKGRVIGYMNVVRLFDCTCACINRITDNSYKGSSNYILIRVMKELYAAGYEFMNDGNAADQEGEHLTSFKNKYLKEGEDGKVFIYQARFS